MSGATRHPAPARLGRVGIAAAVEPHPLSADAASAVGRRLFLLFRPELMQRATSAQKKEDRRG